MPTGFQVNGENVLQFNKTTKLNRTIFKLGYVFLSAMQINMVHSSIKYEALSVRPKS